MLAAPSEGVHCELGQQWRRLPMDGCLIRYAITYLFLPAYIS